MVSIRRNSESPSKSFGSGIPNVSTVGGSTALRPSPLEVRARGVRFGKGTMYIDLGHGRELMVPLDRFPRLLEASASQLLEYELLGGGVVIHWPAVDEDIDVANLVRG